MLLKSRVSSLRRFYPYLPLAALALLAAWPLVHYGLPSVTDGPNHFYRFVELDWHTRNGDFYPRWFADLHYGFGAPVLNFYAPLSYYVPLFLSRIGLSFTSAFLLSYVLSIATAVFGMYFWARDQFDTPLAGLTAAAAYALTPYFYVTLLVRAAYPEVWGLALAPWLFWLTLRLIRNPSWGNRLTLTLLYAVFILTHNLSALLFTPLLILYSLTTVNFRIRSSQTAPNSQFAIKTLGLFTLSLALAIGLSAFYLLPFWRESAYIQLDRADLIPVLDYRNNFLALDTLFSRPIPFDPYHVFNLRPISLPWPQLVLALIALGAILFTKSKRADPASARIVIVHAIALGSLIFLIQETSAPLWDAFALAKLLQFPWRLVGPATLLLAWLSGAGSAHLLLSRWQQPVSLAFIASFFFFSLTWTYHEPYDPLPDTIRPGDVIQYEIDNPEAGIGTTYTQEFLPRWVSELPAADTLLPLYAENAIPSRLAMLPPGATLSVERNSLTATDLNYEAPEPFEATFNLFYFPGWTATVDGEPIPIRISGPHGLINVTLPSGRHAFRLSLQPTRPQLTGSLISLLALLALFIPLPRWGGLSSPSSPRTGKSELRHTALLFIGLLALRVAVLDRFETPFSHTDLDSIANPLSVNFDDQLLLIGYKTPQGNSFSSDETFNLWLYWQALPPVRDNYQTTVQLVDRYGNRFGQSDNQHPGFAPTSGWRADQYARDEHRLIPLSGAPPGEYSLVVGVYSLADEASTVSLSIRGEDGGPVGVEYNLGTAVVTQGRPQPPGPLRLVEATLATDTVGVGDQLTFTVLWNSGDDPLPTLTAHLELAAADGRPIFTTDLPPTGPDYPTDQWTQNELIRYPHSITLPADLPAGQANVTLKLLDPDRAPVSDTYELGTITISVPERTFDIPPLAHPTQHDFAGAIRLLGYDRTPEAITLYWQALQPIDTRLTVFVHRFDAAGAFIAGHDSPPPRPTTSWLPREVIVDIHPIDIGDYFDIGLYDPITGERFAEPLVISP